MNLFVHPLTPDRWADLETVFNARGCSVARRKPDRPVMRLYLDQG